MNRKTVPTAATRNLRAAIAAIDAAEAAYKTASNAANAAVEALAGAEPEDFDSPEWEAWVDVEVRERERAGVDAAFRAIGEAERAVCVAYRELVRATGGPAGLVRDALTVIDGAIADPFAAGYRKTTVKSARALAQ